MVQKKIVWAYMHLNTCYRDRYRYRKRPEIIKQVEKNLTIGKHGGRLHDVLCTILITTNFLQVWNISK